jgi:Domain of unknown function (DUF1905)/Bacteriocin-protection, YdeI or OmpD-Associated
MRFRTELLRLGPEATGVDVPEEILAGLGRGRRVAVVATVDGYAWRTTVGPYRGRILLIVNAGARAATGLRGGETIEVELVADDAPRTVEMPEDHPASLAWLAALAPSHRREHAHWIEEAKRPETRAARVARSAAMIRGRERGRPGSGG